MQSDPNPAVVVPPTSDSPWLFSATGALNLTPGLAVYAGYTRGLEESPVAPQNAVNIGEAPPAIRTEQKDAGVRWRISPGVTAIVGVLDIAKPYFNLDAANRFRQLGMVRHRGVELSVAGQIAPGLNIVAGNIFLDATVSGDLVDRGLIGKRPIGTMKRRTLISLGARYRLKIADKPVLLRALVGNVTNTFGWNVGGSGFFVPNGARRLSLSIAADI
ncbi:TonB-dependent receptor domain-containing protein [Sphingomonas sp. SUN039]|uniref:TonB-dependent receptor domain-containing protein n=1 Tax=Sphingomonas sp. SUN039 TaxID=2937787 RepID=UPI002164CDB3|nr:TonB-dependent receptor [Sphingomonas sp. SUN039]UVO54592.1 TonB-dependent receptor [Sphingomonas sp. SUN039]